MNELVIYQRVGKVAWYAMRGGLKIAGKTRPQALAKLLKLEAERDQSGAVSKNQGGTA